MWNVKYILDFRDYGRKNVNYVIRNFFMLIIGWNDNILDMLVK